MTAQLVAAISASIVAIITGVFTTLTARVRKENGTAHDANFSILKSIDKRTEAIDTKLDRTTERLAEHEGWHRGKGDTI
jgi:predicted kinase